MTAAQYIIPLLTLAGAYGFLHGLALVMEAAMTAPRRFFGCLAACATVLTLSLFG